MTGYKIPKAYKVVMKSKFPFSPLILRLPSAPHQRQPPVHSICIFSQRYTAFCMYMNMCI